MPSCLKVPLIELKKFWAHHHGQVCMNYIPSICKAIKSYYNGQSPRVPPTTGDDLPIAYGLIISLYTLYGRSFKQQDRALRLPEAIVPNIHIPTHNAALNLRDKLFAHVDQGNNAARDDGGDLLGKMIVTTDNNSIQFTSSSVFPRGSGIEEMNSLATAIDRGCRDFISGFIKHYDEDVPVLNGTVLEVNIDGVGEEPLFKFQRQF